MSPPDEAFSFRTTKDGKLLVSWQGRVVTTLKGTAAAKLLARLTTASPHDIQQALARVTGNFKRGNER